MGKSQRAKGAAGEREFAGILRKRGHDARRTGQMQAGWGGTKGDSDVVGLPPFHIEIKRQESTSIGAWIAQAIRDAGDRPWLLAFRRNREHWKVVLDLSVFLDLYEKANGNSHRD